MPLDIIQEKMPLPSIGENAVNGNLLHQHFLPTPLTTVQVLSTPWDDSTVVLSAKVNCRQWVPVYFAIGTSVLRNRISLGIHVPIHTVDYFILNINNYHKQ